MGRLLGDGCERPPFGKLPQYSPNAGRLVAICAWGFKGARDRLGQTLSTRRDDPDCQLCYVIAYSLTAVTTRIGTLRSFERRALNDCSLAKT